MEAVGERHEVTVPAEHELRAMFPREVDGSKRVIDRAGAGPSEQSPEVPSKFFRARHHAS
jgi:hypothetical protein